MYVDKSADVISVSPALGKLYVWFRLLNSTTLQYHTFYTLECSLAC